MKLKFALPLVFSLSLSILFAFQNCGGNVRLSRTPASSIVSLPSRPIGEFCGPDQVDVFLPQNVVMVLDMSASNTSRFQERSPDFGYLGGVPHWYYQLGPAAYADCLTVPGAVCIPATDSDGAGNGRRFTALLNYLRNCPQNQEPTNRYGVIGFSSGVLRAPAFPGRTCEDRLQTRTIAENEITSFNTLQATEVGRGRVLAPAYPFQMDETSYRAALKCMDDRIRNDLNPDAIQRSYKVLFLTDGKPSDQVRVEYVFPGGYITTPLWQEYGEKLASTKSFLSSQGFSFVFQPIYYGLPAERATAVAGLGRMALTVSAGINTIEMDPTSNDFTVSLADSFCRSPAERLSVGYESYGGVQVVPLTHIQQGDQLYADIDMDGVADDLEASGNFSPTLSHTDRVQDSLCLRYRAACTAFQTAAPAPACNPNLPFGVGFTDCDRVFMNQEVIRIQDAFGRTPFTGLDDDGDGILTYHELIKGTDPLDSDLELDPDVDGIASRAEILQGTDPYSSTSAANQAQFRHSLQFTPTTTCTGAIGYRMAINAMPVINVGAFAETLVTPHQENENVFALVYYARPAAYTTGILKVFIRYLKVMNNAQQTVVLGPQIDAGEVRLP